MAEDQYTPTLPPDAPQPWLARNRKIVILGGVVVLAGIVAGLSTLLAHPQATKQANVTQATGLTNTSPTTTTTRPTFQRSTITNTVNTLPPVYRPPTTDDLRKAITNLNTSTSTPSSTNTH